MKAACEPPPPGLRPAVETGVCDYIAPPHHSTPPITQSPKSGVVCKGEEINKTVPGFAKVQIYLLTEGKEQQCIRILSSACMHISDCVLVPISLTSSWHLSGFQKDFGKVQNLLQMSWGEGSGFGVLAGVSCDACLKGNFRGRRYKCLICYDYDLCATCYESGATTTRHTTDHPMQCILTRVDFDLYYGGEAFSVEQPQSFTCPYCGKMGYTETSLQEHVTSEHAETSTEVICPICAALPGGDPNHVTDDFAAHLTLEHRAPRDLDESSGVRHVRRMFHPGRGLGGPRARRSNMHFTTSSPGGLSSSQSSYSPSNREAMDPIAELLSQLSGVRRTAGGQLNSSGPSASQLQQLQMQLQLERQHAQAARQQLETARNATRRTNTINVNTTITQSTTTTNTSNTENSQQTIQNSQFLLTRLNDPKMSEAERQSMESERADCSLFVQELLLSTLMREESSSSDEDERGEFADFGAMGCVDIMPLDVALENLNLKESNKGNEPPPPPL
nr:PREDICTED: E3 ubiquitin-protein ligase KCMF1 [Opisthocomus hoazin]